MALASSWLAISFGMSYLFPPAFGLPPQHPLSISSTYFHHTQDHQLLALSQESMVNATVVVTVPAQTKTIIAASAPGIWHIRRCQAERYKGFDAPEATPGPSRVPDITTSWTTYRNPSPPISRNNNSRPLKAKQAALMARTNYLTGMLTWEGLPIPYTVVNSAASPTLAPLGVVVTVTIPTDTTSTTHYETTPTGRILKDTCEYNAVRQGYYCSMPWAVCENGICVDRRTPEQQRADKKKEDLMTGLACGLIPALGLIGVSIWMFCCKYRFVGCSRNAHTDVDNAGEQGQEVDGNVGQSNTPNDGEVPLRGNAQYSLDQAQGSETVGEESRDSTMNGIRDGNRNRYKSEYRRAARAGVREIRRTLLARDLNEIEDARNHVGSEG